MKENWKTEWFMLSPSLPQYTGLHEKGDIYRHTHAPTHIHTHTPTQIHVQAGTHKHTHVRKHTISTQTHTSLQQIHACIHARPQTYKTHQGPPQRSGWGSGGDRGGIVLQPSKGIVCSNFEARCERQRERQVPATLSLRLRGGNSGEKYKT